jgi:CheY-like chemotaxis protein
MKILLVDDDRPTRCLVSRTLTKRFGCEVTEVPDGLQALEALARDQYGLVVLDVQMPVMSGLETLRALRESGEHASLPVVMLTGERDEATIREILELGVLEYIAKPLDMARVHDRLRRIFRAVVAKRPGAADQPGWLGRALRNTDAPLLVVEGRSPFRECFTATVGARRPVVAADSGVAGMREITTGHPGVVFLGADLGVLREPLLRHRLRTTPSSMHLALIALVDSDEEGDGRMLQYDGTLTRTQAPETLLQRLADLERLGSLYGWDADVYPPGFRATVTLLCEDVFGTALAADMTVRDQSAPVGEEWLHVQGAITLPPDQDIRLEVACDVGTARRAAANLFGIDMRMVRDENVDGAALKVFDLIRTRLAAIYPVPGRGRLDVPPEVGRPRRWSPRVGEQAVATLCAQTPSREHEFWLQVEPVRI